MTKAELVVQVTLAAGGRLTRARSERLVDAVFDEIRQVILENGRFSYQHFGRWTTRRRQARRGFNPHSRERVLMEPSRTVAFHPAPALKAKLGSRKP